MKAQKLIENQRTTASQEAPSNPHLASEEGPRQRLHPQVNSDHTSIAASPAANVSVVPPTVNRATIRTNPADIPQQSRGALRFGSLVLIWLLLLIIGALVFRRIYIMAN